MKHKRKKLNIGIKRNFQMWMLVRILGTVSVSAIVSVSVLYFYAQQEISGTLYDIHITLQKVSDLLLPVILSGAVMSFLSGLALAIFLPQKIAGPIYRIEQDLEEIKNGNINKKIVLRAKDPLKDLADKINETVAALVDRADK